MSQYNISQSPDNNITRLPNEIILYGLLDLLDDKDQQHLSWTCKWLYRFVRINRFGIVSPIWEDVEIANSEILSSSSCYRDGTVINDVLYIPILTNESPYCLSIDLTRRPLELVRNPIKIERDTQSNYEECKFIATAAIQNDLYIFGGQNILTKGLSNAFYVLNVKDFVLKRILSQNVPKARMLHSLNSIDHHRLALFGGQCFSLNGRQYNSKDFYIYDVYQNSWLACNETPTPTPRMNHSTMFMSEKLYIYGGQQKSFFSKSNSTRDDPDVWEYDISKSNWRKYLNPKDKFSPKFLPKNLIATNGKIPHVRCGATLFPINRHIAILGGNENDEDRPWEFIEILSPMKRTWFHLRVKMMPRIEYAVIHKIKSKGIFILGKDQKEGRIKIGFINDEQ